MAKNATNAVSPTLQVWIEARSRHRLSQAHVQMARELGLNPRRIGSIANDDQEPWKLPLPAFIEQLHFERFGREASRRRVDRGAGAPGANEEGRREGREG